MDQYSPSYFSLSLSLSPFLSLRSTPAERLSRCDAAFSLSVPPNFYVNSSLSLSLSFRINRLFLPSFLHPVTSLPLSESRKPISLFHSTLGGEKVHVSSLKVDSGANINSRRWNFDHFEGVKIFTPSLFLKSYEKKKTRRLTHAIIFSTLLLFELQSPGSRYVSQ